MADLYSYYLEESYCNGQYTAGIVRKDNEAILAAEGFTALRFDQTAAGSLPVKLSRLFNAITIAFKCKKNGLVVFHFPLLATVYNLLHTCLKWRHIQTAALVIDIDGLRDKDPEKLAKELKQLGKFDHIIAHNEAMKNFILQHIPAAKIFTIDLFDYPAKAPFLETTFSKSVCIAANHSKGRYVYTLNELAPVQFYLYGEGYNKEPQQEASNVFYKGTVSPAVLPGTLEGSFGLVWDGPSITDCDEYLLYNNPHKLSLYLAAGLPVIVWQQSAVAAMVQQHNIGIVVASLKDLNAALDAVYENDYTLMKQNAIAVGEKIREGYYLKTAVNKIISGIA